MERVQVKMWQKCQESTANRSPILFYPILSTVSYHLSRLEPAHVHRVVEHVLHHCKLLPHSDGMSCQNDLEISDEKERNENVRYWIGEA